MNKPTQVAKKLTTITDNVITTNISDESFKKGIIKSDLLDHLHTWDHAKVVVLGWWSSYKTPL